jgi:hypothetical protein
LTLAGGNIVVSASRSRLLLLPVAKRITRLGSALSTIVIAPGMKRTRNPRASSGMQVYIFISEKDPKIKAFTADETGGNLPARYAPWVAVNKGKSMHLGSANDPIGITVKTDGYQIVIT